MSNAKIAPSTNALETTEIISIDSRLPIFYEKVNNWKLVGEPTHQATSDNSYMGIIADTEFYRRLKGLSVSSRSGLTVQYALPKLLDSATAFTHPDSVDLNILTSHYPVATSEFTGIDYLRYLGYSVEFRQRYSVELIPEKSLTFIIYSHWATAEYLMIVNGELKQQFKRLASSEVHESKTPLPKLEETKRIKLTTPISPFFTADWVEFSDYILIIDGERFVPRFTLIDTGAILGVSSYKNFCNVGGVDIPYKDNFSSEEKSDFLKVLNEMGDDEEEFKKFHQYIMGDLLVYEALLGYDNNWRTIYDRAGVGDYYSPPKLTTGATVEEYFSAIIRNLADITPEDNKSWNKFESTYLEPASASHFRKYPTETKALLSKVFGGRCRNNRSNEAVINNVIVDLDIAGAYGEGQRNQLYMIGVPETVSYNLKDTISALTLRDWLALYGTTPDKYVKGDYGDLIPSAFHLLISTDVPAKVSKEKPKRVTKKEKAVLADLEDNGTILERGQDLFQSWFVEGKSKPDLLVKYLRESMTVDGIDITGLGGDFDNLNGLEFDEESGAVQVLTHQTLNAPLNHDGLQWILTVCSPAQRDEFLDNVRVLTSAVYRKSNRVESIEKLIEDHKNWEGRTVHKSVKVKNKTNLQVTDGQYYGWVGLPMSDLLIDSLLINRKCYKKKTPMNNTYKLIINTTYGDMTSKHFLISNIVVGNNITARCRLMCWCMEKGLDGIASITDGVAFNVNRVVHKGKFKVTAEKLMYVSTFSDREYHRNTNGMKLAPLAGALEYKIIAYVFYQGAQAPLVLGRFRDGDRYFRPKFYFNDEEEEWMEDKENHEFVSFVNEAVPSHLQSLFPQLDVVNAMSTKLKVKSVDDVFREPRKGQFSFEGKGVFQGAAYHSAANYVLTNNNENEVLRMRSYEDKGHQEWKDGVLLRTDFNPANEFLTNLYRNPERVIRQNVFVKESIIKSKEYRQRQPYFDGLGLEFGDSQLKAGLLREFSPSTFSFRTLKQRNKWLKDIDEDKENLGQSLERFFLNDDGTLNYKLMVEKVEQLIRAGVGCETAERKRLERLLGEGSTIAGSYSEYFETHQRKLWDSVKDLKHPSFDELLRVKASIANGGK